MEQEARDRAAGIGPNPEVTPGCVRFNFSSTKKLPKDVATFGFVDYQRQVDGSQVLHVDAKSYVVLGLPMLQANGGGAVNLNQYTIAMHVRFPKYPITAQAILRMAPPTAANSSDTVELVFDGQGQAGISGDCDAAFGQVQPGIWQHICVTFVAGVHAQLFCNGGCGD